MITRLIYKTILFYAATLALMLLVAGTWRWPQAYVFVIEMVVTGLAIGIWLARHDPGLLAERMGSPIQRGQELRDKIFMGVVFVGWHAWLIFIALDRRFDLSHVPVWAQVLGAALILAAMYAFHVTFRENSFAAPVVKYQAERGHTVVSTGPYAYVRHPMYAGGSLLFFGVPLLLGSAYGLALAPLWVLLLASRIPVEERMLREKLAGYTEYAERVRHRLVPGVW
jgi:protein-S-isoprenylcysteine O-methyltransferase Ste14